LGAAGEVRANVSKIITRLSRGRRRMSGHDLNTLAMFLENLMPPGG